MKTALNRRYFMLGSATLAGGALLQASLPPSLRLVGTALGNMTAPLEPIRMSSNENPYGPSPKAIKAMEGAFKYGNLYGGITDEIIAVQAAIEKVPKESIMISNGSGEILQVAGLFASAEPGSVVAAYPTYASLLSTAKAMGAKIINVPVDESMHVDLNAMYAAIKPDTRLVYICNPNNPLPTIIEKKALEDFVRTVSKDRLVFVDEAYYEYVDNPDFGSMMHLIAEGLNNVIVARTASKIHGIAGLRVGFGFAHPDLIRKMSMLATGSVDILAQHAALVSYQDKEFQDFSRAKNKEGLAILEGMYEELGLRYVKSNANFSFFETGIEVDEFRATMREHKILVGRAFQPFTKWARVSIAKPEEMAYFVQTYKQLYT